MAVDEKKRLDDMVKLRKEITHQETLDDSSYELDMNQVLSAASAKSVNVKTILSNAKNNESPLIRKIKSGNDLISKTNENDDFLRNLSEIRRKKNEKVRDLLQHGGDGGDDGENMSKLVTKLAEKQRSFITKATSIDSDNDYYRPTATATVATTKESTQSKSEKSSSTSSTKLINTSSNNQDSVVDVSLNDLIEKNQTEAQMMLNLIKNKNKSFMEAILDN